MKKIFILSLLPVLFLCLAGLTACDDKEDKNDILIGKWHPMEWETDVEMKEPYNSISVPAEGDTYSFTCKNYKYPCIHRVIDGEEIIYSGKENCAARCAANGLRLISIKMY